MRSRGLTLVELLVALLLVGVALGALVALWPLGFTTTQRSQDIGVGYNVARQEIERAKNMGFLLLPEGTWTTAYDGLGNPTASENPHFIATTSVQTIPDAYGEVHSRCLRVLHVEVDERDVSDPVFVSTTYLARGGI
jgi:prepilin-type N-terminal cleavage/methylation domain-containing protein